MLLNFNPRNPKSQALMNEITNKICYLDGNLVFACKMGILELVFSLVSRKPFSPQTPHEKAIIMNDRKTI